MPASAQPLPPLPLSDQQAELLERLTRDLDAQRLWWLSGYAAGMAKGQAGTSAIAAPPPALDARPTPRLTIVYGTQTGNARREAEKLSADAEAAGLTVRLLRADAYPQRELVGERLLYIVISTQGEGDPPDDAIGLVEFIGGRRAPRLPDLHYAVLGLGDSSYADFCGIARRLDARLAELGATPLLAAGEADLDIDTVAAPWREQALAQARTQLRTATPSATVTPLRPHAAPVHSPDRPFAAEVLLNQRISGREFKGLGYLRHGGLGKDIRHLELSLQGSGLHYEPGDALGVRHRNPPSLVDAVLHTLRLSGEAELGVGDTVLPLREWLSGHRELTRLGRPLLAAHAARAGDAGLDALLQPANASQLAPLLGSHQLIDVLRRWPAAWDAQSLVEALRPLAPRLYSIASSRKRVGEEVHLTLDVLDYEAFGHPHLGAASGFLAALEEGAHAPVYVEPNERFRVPADPTRDIIMVGPGTGVAPFRGFVQERAEAGAGGRNWLLFGARHFNTGFLYQSEWQEALRRGELHRLDVAFSRDQAHKVYVQQRLRDHGREVYAWLEGGAHFYVCGAIAMGKDVHATLLQVVSEHAGLDAEGAAEYLAGLQSQGRYCRDVY
jgi:sulfite reductase (NADPH) flavoprotein alpha-component